MGMMLDDMETIEAMSIASLQEQLSTGATTSVQVCKMFMERIQEWDKKVNAVRTVNPQALQIAKERDEERRNGKVRGVLHGVPVLVKDCIDTGDQMSTTCGTIALVDNFAEKDAHIVELLKEAGAIILGKTNLSEWCYIRSTRAVSGWSSVAGQVRNAYILDRSPLGSSSGSAVAMTANMCLAAIGTETDGSITRPASSSGIVGIKPTVGLVSRSGMLGIVESQDTAGPMTKTVYDAAIMLSAIAGADRKDLSTQAGEVTKHLGQDYSRFCKPDALRGARIGVARSLFGPHPAMRAIMERAIEDIRQLGADIVDPIDIALDLGTVWSMERELINMGAKKGADEYLSSTNNKCKVRSLEQLINFNKTNKEKTMPYFEQEWLESAQAEGYDAERRNDILKKLQTQVRDNGIDLAMKQHKLDALIAPTEGTPAFCIDPLVGDNFVPFGSSCPPATAGYPHITVPAGQIHGLPVGLSFFALAFEEPKIIAYAYSYEQATKHRRTPGFLPTL
mmetsp:Transcript_2884/g.4145  ORF Transcript_2884/g.4145 Transcript_2884/m.4145 type:complete len:507 (+) Transcript_2884:101-1621(+)